MDQIKQHLFWIILGVILLVGVAVWFNFMPNVDEARNEATKDEATLQQDVNKLTRIKNDASVKAAAEYGKAADEQKAAILKQLEGMKLDTRFSDVPDDKKPSIEFDQWLSNLRTKLVEKMKANGVQPPADFDRQTFAELGIDDKSAEIKRHRVYRLRYMAILDEVVEALCAKTGNASLLAFETNPAKDEANQQSQVGANSLVRFVFHSHEETAKIAGDAYKKALSLSGRPNQGVGTDKNEFKGPDMPLTVTSVDVEFTGHISTVPAIIRKLESSSRYYAIVTRADSERAADPYFKIDDSKIAELIATAGPVPVLNTRYAEGPVKVLVTMNLHEFDKKKVDELESKPAVATPPKNAPKK